MRKQTSMSEILSKRQIYKKKLDRFAVNGGANDRGIAGRLVTLVKASDTNINGVSIEDVNKNITAQFASIKDVVTNYEYLNQICNGVNSIVEITIAGRTMTIAQALALNTVSLKSAYNGIITRMKDDYKDMIEAKEKYESKTFSETAINNYLQVTIGATVADSENNQKVKERLEEYREMNKIVIIDPLEIVNAINKMEEFVEDFFDNVNFRLAELNAKIVVEYDMDDHDSGWKLISPAYEI